VFDAFDSPWRPGTRALAAAPAPAAATPQALVPAPLDLSHCSDLRAAVSNHERDILAAALAKCRHNQRATATALALTYDQLRHALKRHNMLERTPS
ncbi:MAG: phage shock protein operon transcriptional activator, partial [Rhizobiales bacterium]|nr:phage shock protein operon transcriptional activator [Rhizobacter sp.]